MISSVALAVSTDGYLPSKERCTTMGRHLESLTTMKVTLESLCLQSSFFMLRVQSMQFDEDLLPDKRSVCFFSS
ncbi:hypothetical protein OPV22_015766 [Ensete ventricosum]|uniref:Uncharacterized protein n=1 Tax=Ensete ventricosum TaxID=4639 RepID=A0AAV8RAM1_ENSVE|nr:hypothetical protein OPV22_015766 [Ensete ventricosum]